ncbi:MAG: ribonuclease P protein component [Paracoccaceae bacterium]|nr:ribonuclease P protein component [Paracoccaceae bacterium]
MSPAPGPSPRDGGPAVSVSLETLRNRADFLAANAGRRAPTPGLVLLGRDRGDGGTPRVGFTCSKKLGNAVTRNRAKRRLRALAREVLAPDARSGWDYVLIGRRDATVTRPYAQMSADLARAIARLHGAAP